MKTKWLSLLGAMLGMAVILGGCKKDDLERRDFYPAAQISFHVPDSTITAADIYLNPAYGQPEITIKVRSPQGINRATLVTYKNNGDPLNLEVIDQEVKTFTLFRDTIYFTIPAGTVGIGDDSYVYEMQTEANHGALRTMRKTITWNYGGDPVVTFDDAQLPEYFGAAEYEVKGLITSDVGIKEVSYCLVTGGFNENDPNLENVGLPTSMPAPTELVLKRGFSFTFPSSNNVAKSTGIWITVTDLLDRTTTAYLFRATVAAPTFESFPVNLPADFADGAYQLAGTVKSDGGLVDMTIEMLAGSYGSNGLPEITDVTWSIKILTFPDPNNFNLNISVPDSYTTGHFGVRITATDRFGQESVKEIFIPNTLAAPPAVTFGSAKLPTVFSYTGAPLTGAITTDTQLTSVVVKVLTGTFSGGTPNATGSSIILTETTFTDPQNYDLDISAPATAGAIGIEVVATDNQGLITTKTVYATDPAMVTTMNYPYDSGNSNAGQAWGYKNKNNRGTLWSVSQRQGYAFSSDTNGYPLPSATTTIGEKEFTNFWFGDFIFWAPDSAQEGFELWSIKAVNEYGGNTYFSSTRPEYWTYFNNTWFMWLGNSDVAPTDPNYIDWNSLNFTTMYQKFANNYAATNQTAGNRLLISQTGNSTLGLRVGDVVLICLDANKPMETGGGLLAAIRVNSFKFAGRDPEEYHETRLNMDLILESE